MFSSTLTGVEGNARLATGSVGRSTRSSTGSGHRRRGLAGSCPELIDEYGLFVSPVAVGGGTPFFPLGSGST